MIASLLTDVRLGEHGLAKHVGDRKLHVADGWQIVVHIGNATCRVRHCLELQSGIDLIIHRIARRAGDRDVGAQREIVDGFLTVR